MIGSGLERFIVFNSKKSQPPRRNVDGSYKAMGSGLDCQGNIISTKNEEAEGRFDAGVFNSGRCNLGAGMSWQYETSQICCITIVKQWIC